MNKSKLQKILKAISPNKVDFSAIDKEVATLKKKLEETVNIATVDDVKSELNKFKNKIDLSPLISEIDKIGETFTSKSKELQTQIDEKTKELETMQNSAKSMDEQCQKDMAKMEMEIKDLRNKMSEMEVFHEADMKETTDDIAEAKAIENKLNDAVSGLLKDIDTRSTKKDTEKTIKDFQDKIDELRRDLLTRIGSIHGGGNANRQMFIGGADPLTRYTDMNLKAGTNTTITYADNNTTKQVDVTFTATGGSGGHTIQDEGTPLTARANLNFVGSGVTATDDAGNNATIVTIPSTPITGKANVALDNLASVAINTDLIGAVAGGMGIRGGSAANDYLILEGTTNATRTTSYVILQPNGGNVGIGTTSPGAKLQVAGGSILLDNAQPIQWKDSTGVVKSVLQLYSDNNIYLDSPTDLVLRSGGASDRLHITSTGLVGIGVTPTTYNFQVGASSGTNAATVGMGGDLRIGNYDSGIAYLQARDTSGAGNNIQLQINTQNNGAVVSAVRIDNNGNVGIGTTVPKSSLHVSGSFGAKVVTKVFADSPYTAASETVILCDCTAGAITINLPVATNSTDRIYFIKKIDATANAITIDGNASETIDGALTQIISNQYVSIQIVCDGSNWYII